jgi:hypothetical protein
MNRSKEVWLAAGVRAPLTRVDGQRASITTE